MTENEIQSIRYAHLDMLASVEYLKTIHDTKAIELCSALEDSIDDLETHFFDILPTNQEADEV